MARPHQLLVEIPLGPDSRGEKGRKGSVAQSDSGRKNVLTRSLIERAPMLQRYCYLNSRIFDGEGGIEAGLILGLRRHV